MKRVEGESAIVDIATGTVLRVTQGSDTRYAPLFPGHLDDVDAVSYAEIHGKPVYFQ